MASYLILSFMMIRKKPVPDWPVFLLALAATRSVTAAYPLYRLLPALVQSLPLRCRQLRLIGTVMLPDPLQIVRILKHSGLQDRKSTRLNSSHVKISYAVFC